MIKLIGDDFAGKFHVNYKRLFGFIIRLRPYNKTCTIALRLVKCLNSPVGSGVSLRQSNSVQFTKVVSVLVSYIFCWFGLDMVSFRRCHTLPSAWQNFRACWPGTTATRGLALEVQSWHSRLTMCSAFCNFTLSRV